MSGHTRACFASQTLNSWTVQTTWERSVQNCFAFWLQWLGATLSGVADIFSPHTSKGYLGKGEGELRET